MPIEVVDRYTRRDLRANPEKLFIFGDNNARVGLGGQAREARGEPNAVGVRTKKAPTYEPCDFLIDAEFALNTMNIVEDFRPAVAALREGKTVVWPADGIGTGIARLKDKAPLTLSFIWAFVQSLKLIYGVTATERNQNEA